MDTATELAEIQRMCQDLGLRVPATIEEARRKHNTVTEIPEESLSERTRFATPGQKCGSGRVRKISDRQLSYLRHLLNTRRYHKLIGQKWFPKGVNSHAETLAAVEYISLAGARTMISELLTCPMQPGVSDEPMATDAQKSYARSLADRKGIIPAVDFDSLTRKQMSEIIEKYNAIADKPVATPTVADAKAIAGLYELDGSIYRMKKARQGVHFYAELLTDADSGAFEYAQGMARKVPAEGRKLSLEECEALSGIMGVCCMCSRELTATVDGVGPAARFIGPVCAGKMGF